MRKFHHQLCTTRVLDPACGSGNFLYVTLEHLKRLGGEVLNQLSDLGENQDKLGFEGETVTPQQLLGIEINAHAAPLAELVPWIGYLQRHIRTRGNKPVAEPVVHDYGNIEWRDAVLAWDDMDLAYDADGHLLSRWDGKTFKLHPVTGALVPDEAALVPQWKYSHPRQAAWPQADFIVVTRRPLAPAPCALHWRRLCAGAARRLAGSAGECRLCDALVEPRGQVGDGGRYTSLRPDHTNSLRQTFNRRLVQTALDKGVALTFAIPDHP